MKIKVMNPLMDNVIPLPTKGTADSAAFDLRACIQHPIELKAGESCKIPTGLAFEFTKGWCGFVLPRSGLGTKHGIVLKNTIGLIDPDYQGEVFMPVMNISDETFIIHPGDELMQLMQIPYLTPEFEIVEDFGHTTGRGEGGFNSTGFRQ